MVICNFNTSKATVLVYPAGMGEYSYTFLHNMPVCSQVNRHQNTARVGRSNQNQKHKHLCARPAVNPPPQPQHTSAATHTTPKPNKIVMGRNKPKTPFLGLGNVITQRHIKPEPKAQRSVDGGTTVGTRVRNGQMFYAYMALDKCNCGIQFDY